LRTAVTNLTAGVESPSAVAAAVEFILEGLHLSKRLNKDALGTNATYRGKARPAT
jgi:magnesium chelatase subunit I